MSAIGACLRYIRDFIFRFTVGLVFFILIQMLKFLLVLLLAFAILNGIFDVLDRIMPESAKRMSKAAVELIARAPGLIIGEESEYEYPHIVDLPGKISESEELLREDIIMQRKRASELTAEPNAKTIEAPQVDSEPKIEGAAEGVMPPTDEQSQEERT